MNVAKLQLDFDRYREELNNNPEWVYNDRFMDAFFETAWELDEAMDTYFHCETYREDSLYAEQSLAGTEINEKFTLTPSEFSRLRTVEDDAFTAWTDDCHV